MIKTTTTCASLLCSILSLVSNAQEAPKPDSPAATIVAYEQALKKGDLDAAKSLTATFDKIPAEALNKYTEKYSEGAKSNKITMKPAANSAKVIEDCAVVTVIDGNKERIDYDPAYLIKQGGKWKVLLKLTKWNNPMFELSEEQKKRFAELEKWYNEEENRLNNR